MSTAKEIFLGALDLEGAQREAFVEQACAGDAALRRDVEGLLRAEASAGGFMTGVDSVESGLGVGSVVGAYTLVRELGEGGFGTVYLARQDEPVRREVALKVIKAGMDTRQVIRRFRAERQSLAVMNHPAIAKVYDAGTVGGRPYFAMEYVPGESITRGTDRKRLSVRERLALFVRVCHAVQHAHAKGVVHRDLKPSNVLVSEVDGALSPKVIDFGIAKAVRGGDAGQSVMTHATQIVGTPQYMAPEQASIDQSDVDTRADVYSLGVILYELLTGSAMFGAELLSDAAPSELERLIREVQPARPSSRVSRLGDAGDEVGQRRRVDPKRLARSLRGDLDWIVLRAIEKDRSRRYPTAYALASDVERYLRHEPVEAGPPSRAYHVSKFVRRHRAPMIGVGVAAAAVVLLAVGGVWFGLREREARQRADAALVKSEAMAVFAQSIFAGVDPAEARGQDTTLLRSILAGAGDRVGAELGDQPGAAAEMHNMIGKSYLSIGSFDEAEASFREAARVAEDGLGATAQMTLISRSNVVSVLIETNRFGEAVGESERILTIRRQEYGDEDEHTLSSLGSLGYLYQQLGRSDDAVSVLEPLLEARTRVLGADHENTLLTTNNLAAALNRVGDRERASALFERVLESQLIDPGEEHPRTLATMNNLAGTWSRLGRREEAGAMLARVIGIKRRVLPPGHPSLGVSLFTLGDLSTDLERYDEAGAMLGESLEIIESVFGHQHLRTATVLNSLGKLAHARGEPEAAIQWADESLEIFESLGQGEHPNVLALRGNRARYLLDAGRVEEAITEAEDVRRQARDRLGPDSSLALGGERTMGRAMVRLGQVDEAMAMLVATYDRLAAGQAGGDAARDHAEALADICREAGVDDSGKWELRSLVD